MFKRISCLILSLLTLLFLSVSVFAGDVNKALENANKIIDSTITMVTSGDMEGAKKSYSTYSSSWAGFEDAVKEQSKKAYGDIEDNMGMVQFLFSQSPIPKDKLLNALESLKNTNENFLQGKYSDSKNINTNNKIKVKDLVLLLEKAEGQIKAGDSSSALSTMKTFSSSWLEVEGDVLTKSQRVYSDAEKDMVAAKAYLSTDPIQPDKALKVIERMHSYLSQVSGENSYSIIDVITIILREGLEALLVVIALLGFLKKSGNEDKKSWIYNGVAAGFIVSILLAVLVKFIFTSGTFGNNNFLISGWTGIFAAVMLIYVSYWLHSKSSASEWQNYIKNKSTKALATGSLFSLSLLAFLAVFREGTETVLFYIGMASSVSLSVLLSGIALGIGILILIAVLVLKAGLRIPMRPFFLISSLLVFYLGIKFTGMGINGLQLSGILPATSSDLLPTIPSLAVYPYWESIIPQIILVIAAILLVVKNYINSKQLGGYKG